MRMVSKIIDDLLSRFYLNLPESERLDVNRCFYHLENAYWHYLDFYSGFSKDKIMMFSKSTTAFVNFANDLLSHIPPKLKKPPITEIRKQYELYISEYKHQIPVAGCVLLTKVDDKWYALMIKGVATPNLGFPKGKVNKNESLLDAAIRETWEEVGYEIQNKASAKEHPGWAVGKAHFFPITDDKLNVNFPFQPKTRGEIELVCWVPVVPAATLGLNGITLTRVASIVWPKLLEFIDKFKKNVEHTM